MRPIALVLCGSRRINKRIARFAESLHGSGFDPVLAAFPRRQWATSSIEDPALVGTRRFATLRRADPAPRQHGRFQRPALIVCTHWSLLPLAVILKLLFQVPLVYDEHDHYELLAFEAGGPPWANRVRSRVIGIVHAWFLPRTDLVTCIRLAGGQLKASLDARAPTVIELHNYPSRRWADGRGDRTDPSDSIAIVYVGGIWAEKGCAAMLDAFVRLADDPSLPTLTLHAFGSGDPEIEQRLSVAARTTFHGSVPYEEIVTFLAEHDCLGLVLLDATARYTQVSTNCHKLYEYLAAGVPVLATDVGELAGIVAAADGGWTIPPGLEAKELADAIREIVSDPQEVRRRGDTAAAAMDRDGLWWDAEWAKVEGTGVLDCSQGPLSGATDV